MSVMVPCCKQLFPSLTFDRFLAVRTASPLASLIYQRETGRVVGRFDSSFLARVRYQWSTV
jgi:hypothetical protein